MCTNTSVELRVCVCLQVCIFVDCESAGGRADVPAALRMMTGLGQMLTVLLYAVGVCQ